MSEREHSVAQPPAPSTPARHTAGPWEIKRGAITWEIASATDYVGRVYSTAREEDIAKDAEGMANARLIAAAPDLWAFARECARADSDCGEGIRQAARAVLARAEGGAA